VPLARLDPLSVEQEPAFVDRDSHVGAIQH
jgi:hypothetical protein